MIRTYERKSYLFWDKKKSDVSLMSIWTNALKRSIRRDACATIYRLPSHVSTLWLINNSCFHLFLPWFMFISFIKMKWWKFRIKKVRMFSLKKCVKCENEEISYLWSGKKGAFYIRGNIIIHWLNFLPQHFSMRNQKCIQKALKRH